MTLHGHEDHLRGMDLLNQALRTKFQCVWADMAEVRRKLILEAVSKIGVCHV